MVDVHQVQSTSFVAKTFILLLKYLSDGKKTHYVLICNKQNSSDGSVYVSSKHCRAYALDAAEIM